MRDLKDEHSRAREEFRVSLRTQQSVQLQTRWGLLGVSVRRGAWQRVELMSTIFRSAYATARFLELSFHHYG